MGAILSKILGVMGWKKVMLMAWAVAHKELAKRAADTEDREWDDDLVAFADEFVKAITV